MNVRLFAGRPRCAPLPAALLAALFLAVGCGLDDDDDPPPPRQDFDVGAVTVLTDQPQVGHALVLEFALDATEPAEHVGVSFYLMSVEDFEPDGSHEQYLLGSTVIPRVEQGTHTYSVDLVVPADMGDVPNGEPPERFQVFASVDPIDAIPEREEHDNHPLEQPASVPIRDSEEETPNLTLTSLRLDAPLIELVDHDAQENETLIVDGIRDHEDHHVGATVELVLHGADELRGVPLRFWIEIPGTDNPADGPGEPDWWPLQAWPEEEEEDPLQPASLDGDEPDYAETYTVDRLTREEPQSVHVDLLIPSAPEGQPDATFETLQAALNNGAGRFTVHCVVDPDDEIAEYEDPDTPQRDPEFGDNVRSDEVVVTPPAAAPTSFLRAEEGFHKDWSNRFAGVGAAIDAEARIDTDGAFAGLVARLPVTLCGAGLDFLRLDTHAFYDPGNVEASEFELELLFAGQVLYTFSGRVEEETDAGFEWDETFQVEKTQRSTADFFIGPVPIDVELEVTGQLGFRVDVELATQGLFRLEAEPFLDASVIASLGVGNALVSAGVDGRLDLIDERFNLTASCPELSIQGSTVTGELDVVVTNRLDGPSGAVEGYVQYPGIKWCRKFGVPYPCGTKQQRDTKPIVKWSPYRKHDVLLDYHRQLPESDAP